MSLLSTSLSTYTIGNFSFFFDERHHIPALIVSITIVTPRPLGTCRREAQ